MTLYLTYDGTIKTIVVPDDTDFTLMIESFYNEQVEWAKKIGHDPTKVRRKTPQEILYIISKKEFIAHKRFCQRNNQPLADIQDNRERYDEGFIVEQMADTRQAEQTEKKLEAEELHKQLLQGGMSEEQYQLILQCISLHSEEKMEDLADNMGIPASALTMRLQRAKLKFEKITGHPLVF